MPDLSSHKKIHKNQEFTTPPPYQRVEEFCLRAGVDPNLVHSARAYLSRVISRAQELKIHKYPSFRSFLNNENLYPKAIEATFLTGLISEALQIPKEQSIDTIGIASLFYNVGLNHMPREIYLESQNSPSHANELLFKKHAEIGSDLLKNVTGTHPLASLLVRQQNERKAQKSFSRHRRAKLKGVIPEQVHPLSEVLGINQKMIEQWIHSPAHTQDSLEEKWIRRFLEEGLGTVLRGRSEEIREGFRSIFKLAHLRE